MTRYSASRGILYSAPPGPSGNRGNEDANEDASTEEPTAEAETDATADATADD
ncbi:hypothetical protein [Natronomonas amylolytica]|uniref:hypothetical protein n=1 Tax=Natronomonas amylolytica TaxID=3108498 RepID=UPI00300970BA